MSFISGKCLCGNISYQSFAEPEFTANCHCTDCRAATGAVYSTICFIKADQLTINGKTKTFQHLSDRGNTMTKHFCPTCGSQLFGENTARNGMIGIRAGSIDQIDKIKPSRQVYISSRIPSTPIDSELPVSHRMPEN
ncbi:MAG: hypothetical protein CMF69_11880 [Magnetovibrio sp.]|nr:hypothetical protein [Magnetovibrio sp.]|tara:strand:- start:1392 stop:1802 length:411 start_codon:yes stop_codon:yes gene_type:complete